MAGSYTITINCCIYFTTRISGVEVFDCTPGVLYKKASKYAKLIFYY